MPANFLSVKQNLPILGTGLGLRRGLFDETLENAEVIDWLEIIPENFIEVGGRAREMLKCAASRFPLVSHGVNLSIGSVDRLNFDYLRGLKGLLDQLGCPWWSDHLCFSSANGIYMHDLLPLPYTRETVKHVVGRIRLVQEYMERPFLLENISCYMRFAHDEMTEPEFLSAVLEEADCGLLLDVNNVYVNSVNFGFDPYQYLNSIPLERAVQIHIAGHKRREGMIIDTHGAPIIDAVYDLLAYTIGKTRIHAILLERDQNFPDFKEIEQELAKIRSVVAEYGSGDVNDADRESRSTVCC